MIRQISTVIGRRCSMVGRGNMQGFVASNGSNSQNQMLCRLSSSALPEITVTKADSQPADVIHITSSCANRIKELATKKATENSDYEVDEFYLRVFVDAGGCSGFQYKFEVEDDESLEDEDIVFSKDGARVIIDESSMNLLKGSTVDFVQEMIRSSFIIKDNPQTESACGCGSSFAVKNFEANPALD